MNDYCPVCTANLWNGRFYLTVCSACKHDLEDPANKTLAKPVAIEPGKDGAASHVSDSL